MRFSKYDVGAVVDSIKGNSHRLEGQEDLDPLMERIGDARVVLLGEASHGTHDYYTWRSRISKRLIQEKGFSIVAVEGDWPDCYRINRYVKGYENSGSSAEKVLHEFRRWPTWMWANWEMVALFEWMRDYNTDRPKNKRVGFYGLDVYSLWESLDEIKNYLEKTDPVALSFVQDVFKCFEPYMDEEGRQYAKAAKSDDVICAPELIMMLAAIQERVAMYNSDPEAGFNIEQNARVAVDAERYYRAMMEGGSKSWNARDEHMAETLDRLLEHYGPKSKIIVWEHNTHVGDARATDMKKSGMVNLGQLVRQQYGSEKVVIVGFGSYEGSLIAGGFWGDVMKKMIMPPAKELSWEAILHQSGDDKLLLMDDFKSNDAFYKRMEHRAVGVVYNPEIEQYVNYVPSILPRRYDAFIFLNETQALHPLHIIPDGKQMPGAYPWGI